MDINEIAILKSCAVKLDDDLVAISAYVFHTADRKANPEDKSWYKYICYVDKISKIEADIESRKSPEHRLETWMWKSPAWADSYHLAYDYGSNNAKAARWFTSKLKKTLTWDKYVRIVKDGVKTLSTKGQEKFYTGAAYDIDGYCDSDGNLYNITDKASLMKLEGKMIWKDCPLKRQQKNV